MADNFLGYLLFLCYYSDVISNSLQLHKLKLKLTAHERPAWYEYRTMRVYCGL